MVLSKVISTTTHPHSLRNGQRRALPYLLLLSLPCAVPGDSAIAAQGVRLTYKYRPKQVLKLRKVAKLRAVIQYAGEERVTEGGGTFEMIIREEVLQVKDGVGATRLQLDSFSTDQTYPDGRIQLKAVGNQPSIRVNGALVDAAHFSPGATGLSAGIQDVRRLNSPMIVLRNPHGHATLAPGYPPAANPLVSELLAPLVAFPDREVKVGQTWGTRSVPTLPTGEPDPNADPAVVLVTAYTLKAVEKRNGSQVAVISVVARGRAQTDPGLPPSRLSYRGTVRFDVSRGRVVSAQLSGDNEGIVRCVPVDETGLAVGTSAPNASVKLRFSYDISEVRPTSLKRAVPKSPQGEARSKPPKPAH